MRRESGTILKDELEIEQMQGVKPYLAHDGTDIFL